MTKKFEKILIALGILFLIYEIVAFTGIFKFYSNPSIANEPNLPLDSKMFVSNVKEPKIGDFVCYKYQDEILGNHVRVHRLIGMENDIIKIKNGTVFLNDINIDQHQNLVHFYELTLSDYEGIKNDEKITENSYVSKVNDSTIMLLLDDYFAKSKGFELKRKVETAEKIDQDILNAFGKSWNKDNFGPLKIAKNKIFVLGDNRDNSVDSRMIGFIDKSDIVGVVLK